MHAVEERYDTSGSTDSDEFTETFHNLKVSSKCLHVVSTRGEALTTIEVQCPQKRSNQFLRLKIDRELKEMRCQCAHSGKCMVTLNQRKSSHPLDRPLSLLTREKKLNVWEALHLDARVDRHRG